MRRMRLLMVSLVLLIPIAGCSDQSTSAPTAPSAPDASRFRLPRTTPAGELIVQLFPRPILRPLALATLAVVELEAARGHTRLATRAAQALTNWTLELLRKGKLLDPNGSSAPTTEAAVAELTCDLRNEISPGSGIDCSAFGGMAGEVLDHGGAVGIIGDEGGTLTTPTRHEGISVPSGATNTPRVIVIDPLPPEIPAYGPIAQPRCIVECAVVNEYPLFNEFSVSPAGAPGQPDFTQAVTIGICHLDAGDGEFAPPSSTVEQELRIGHTLQPTVGPAEMQVLRQTNPSFLSCADFNSGNLPPVVTGFLGRSWRTVARVAHPLVQALLPAPAYASTTARCCLGGLATKLSPFGAVDPGTPLPALSPSLEGSVQSSEGPATEIFFANQTADSVLVYWLDYNGQRVLYSGLGAGRAYIQQTYVTHPWLITDLQGNGLAIFQPAAERGFAEFTGPVQ